MPRKWDAKLSSLTGDGKISFSREAAMYFDKINANTCKRIHYAFSLISGIHSDLIVLTGVSSI